MSACFCIYFNKSTLLVSTSGINPFSTSFQCQISTLKQSQISTLKQRRISTLKQRQISRLPSYSIYILQLVRFARCCTGVLDFHSKKLQISSKLLTQGYRYHKLRKTFGKFFRSYSELLSKFGDISFQEYLSKGISHPVFYDDLVNKLRRVKDTPNFISSGSKIVKRLRRRQYDPVIIERTIGLVLGPSTALQGPFLKHFTLTNKVVGTI